jgi:acyl-CoA synthetase (AMP-forming)/AMP-acid ligase II
MPGASPHIFDMVRRWEAADPDRVAVRADGASWTWAEFAGRIRRNASAQRAAGVAAGERVAFLDKNHPACLETTLGCALAGTANAVANFRLAPEELIYVINDSGARVLFAGTEFLPVIEQIRPRLTGVERVIAIGGDADAYEQFLAGAPDAEPGHTAQADDCFLQLYTSGTTGYPKGAMLTHRSMIAHSRAASSGCGLSRDCVNMVAMPLFHVGGTSWALAGMSVGSETVVVRELVPDQVLAQFSRDHITHTFVVPAAIGFFLQVPGAGEYDYSSLRCLAYGGSPMPTPLLHRALEAFRGVGFYQVYGMTEASGAVSMLGPEDHRNPDHPERLLSAGLPLPGVQLRVTDPATGEPVPDGELGEIEVRGDLLMSGYWQRPADTAAVIVDGWLHSGDAGHRDSGGYFYVEDRVKDMIISGGENVYPAEVERVLSEYPGVAEVAVIGVPDEKWGEAVKAIVAPQPGVTIDTGKLLEYCRPRLAGFKRPASVDITDALPRNATGKILKRTLREPYWAGRQRAV